MDGRVASLVLGRRILVASVAAVLAPAALAQAPQPAAPLDEDGFLALSRAATEHAELEPVFAPRLFASLSAADSIAHQPECG
jgi:hypothetical protein